MSDEFPFLMGGKHHLSNCTMWDKGGRKYYSRLSLLNNAIKSKLHRKTKRPPLRSSFEFISVSFSFVAIPFSPCVLSAGDGLTKKELVEFLFLAAVGLVDLGLVFLRDASSVELLGRGDQALNHDQRQRWRFFGPK